MMNYTASARSNYFRVKDEAAFRAWANRSGLEVYEDTEAERFERAAPGGEKQYMIAVSDGDGWPSYYADPDTGEDFALDLTGDLAKHLHDDDVAILMEAGAEGVRYVNAYALAVNAKGKVKSLGLANIYRWACGMGKRVTRAEY